MKIIVALAVIFALINASFAVRSHWTQEGRADKNAIIPLTFTLQQRNLDLLEKTLLDVASPKSENYGKWWSQEQILDLIAPSHAISEQVVKYLKQHGAETVENQRDVVISSFTVAKAETLLRTKFFTFTHKNGKSKLIAAPNGITVPEHIERFIDVITGAEEFPTIRSLPTAKPTDTAAYVIPETIQKIYNIPATFEKTNSSLCLAEFQNDNSYSKSDLADFTKQMGIPSFTVTHTVGPYNGDEPDAESTLDVQYGGATAVNQSIWFWTVKGWMMEFATALFAAKQAPLVVSMSWGWPEPEQCQIDTCTGSSYKYVDRVNVEFQKIGLRGISLLAASGDQGAPGDNNAYCSNDTQPLSTIFPGASPWVLSVGATMLAGQSEMVVPVKNNSAEPPICSTVKCATTDLKEITCTYPTALITTGGGFSNYSPRPKFQDKTVTAYLKEDKHLPKSKFFNSSNRGFPDVSALGHNYLIGIGGQYEQVDGTSCSSPVFGGVITLLNAYRIKNGKAPLGYVVPLVYEAYASNPEIFIDITVGNNKCTESCCADGFEAAKGWDPVTGLGSPNFPAFLKYVQSLP